MIQYNLKLVNVIRKLFDKDIFRIYNIVVDLIPMSFAITK